MADHRQHSQQHYVNPMTGVRQLEVSVDVTRSDVEKVLAGDTYACVCFAWSSTGRIKSRRAVVSLAGESSNLSLLFNAPADRTFQIITDTVITKLQSNFLCTGRFWRECRKRSGKGRVWSIICDPVLMVLKMLHKLYSNSDKRDIVDPRFFHEPKK